MSLSKSFGEFHAVRRARGFTLVELLIVIGIIAVLIAILLPALIKARAQANSVACLSNTRQLAIAVIMYADSNGGRLPHYFFEYAPNAPGDQVWSTTYILADGGFLPASKSADGILRVGALRCPAEPDRIEQYPPLGQVVARFRNNVTRPVYVSAGADPRQAQNGQRSIYTNYVFNGQHPAYKFGYRQARPFTNWYPSGQPVPFLPSECLEPQQKLSKAKRDTWIAWDGIYADVAWTSTVFRHPGLSANFTYLDGHSENLKVGDVDDQIMFTSWDARLDVRNVDH